jgi:hypothetical protein
MRGAAHALKGGSQKTCASLRKAKSPVDLESSRQELREAEVLIKLWSPEVPEHLLSHFDDDY